MIVYFSLKLFETNSIAIGTKEILQRNLYVKNRHFFTKWHFEKFIKRINGGYEMIWKFSAYIKRKFYCFEDFSKPLAFFCVSKNIN